MTDDAHGNISGKRLVIFGCGYVGSEVARQGISQGLRVTALTRNESKAAFLRDAGVEVVIADLAAEDWHARIGGGADFVLNCVSSGGAGLAGYRRSYVEGMESVLGWAETAGPAGTLIYTSSTSVYPQGGGIRVDETALTDETPERGQILLEAEAKLRAAVEARRRWFVLRLAGIYGPGRHSLLDQVRGGGEVAGLGEHRLNLIHRDDICAAVWRGFRAPATMADQIFNVADDGAARKSEIIAWLAARLNLSVPRFSGEPLTARRNAAPDRVIANDKIKALLGWRPTYPTFREGYENLLSLS